MGPLGPTSGLPESFLRRRGRAGSNEHVGELPAISGMPTDEKSSVPPASPKSDLARSLQISKSQENVFPFPTVSDRAWASLSREHLSASDEDSSGEFVRRKESTAIKQSLFRDLCQTQLSLWTFAVSTLLTYFWQKRVHVRSVAFAACAVSLTIFMSGILAAVVVAAHLFNSDFAESFGGFGDWLSDDESKYPQLLRRQSSTRSKSRRTSCASGTTSPRGGAAGGDKLQQAARYWQKNVSLERSYIGSSRS